jgi:hypothetical protein
MNMTESVGRLLQAYSQFKETGVDDPDGRRTIQNIRQERLREGLSFVDSPIPAESAAVLADAMAVGKLAIADAKMYLSNNGGIGIKAQCSCKDGTGNCKLTVSGNQASCNSADENPCKQCSFILGLTVAAPQFMAIASDPALLGQNFLDQLPPIAADTANDLAKLTYPLADRLALHDQIQDRELVPNKALMEISFPVLSLSDALDKFFARRPGNLMRWAVGDYETAIVRNLALALSAGTIRVSASSRQLEVILMSKGGPGAVIDLSCDCLRGRGECQMIINPSGQNITCSGSCKECTIQVVITGSSLGYSLA